MKEMVREARFLALQSQQFAVPAEFGGHWVKKQPGLPLEDFIEKNYQDIEILLSDLLDSLNLL